MENKPLLVTHDSTFHADDVFATATLAILLKDNYELVRTRDMEIIKKADYVYDVGGEHTPEKNIFDHHQIGGAGARENGIPYASFGLVWKKYGEEICGSKEVSNKIDERLVQPIDASDNGVAIEKDIFENLNSYTINSIIKIFRPTWKEEQKFNDIFKDLVIFAKKILEREIVHAKDLIDAEKIVIDIYNKTIDKRIILIEPSCPAQKILKNFPEPLIIVNERPDGKWNARVIESDEGEFSRRISFPKPWAGLREQELQKVTGVSDAVFCHNGLFMVVALSKEGAIRLAEKALELSQ